MPRTILSILCLSLLPSFAVATEAGDPEKGEKVYKKCKACHAVGENAKNRTGPVLNGIVGAAIAANADFKYSTALQELAAEDRIWTEEELSAFLAKPKDFAPGTKMTFPGLKKEEDRANVIAYLATFSE